MGSQAKKNLVRIVPAVAALLMVGCVCVGFTTPDMVATGVVLTLTSSHSTRQALAANQSPTPTITATPTTTPTPTITPTTTSTTQGAQAQPAKPSTPTRTSTKPTGSQNSTVEIVSFTTDKAQVTRPDKAILKWETKNADTVTLKYDGGGPANVDKTSNSFAVDTTTLGLGKHTITLTATGGGKSVTKTVTFEILAAANVPPPATSVEIVFFTIDKATITTTESTFVKWETKNADVVSINLDGGIEGPVDKSSSGNGLEIFGKTMAAGKHTLNLTATGGGKTVTKPVTFEVLIPAAGPTISSFTTDKTCLNGGEIATLNWTVTGADSNSVWIDVYKDQDANPFLTIAAKPMLAPYTIGDHNLGPGTNKLIFNATNAVGSVFSAPITIIVPCP